MHHSSKITKRKIKKQMEWYSFIIVSIITLIVLVYIPMITTVKYSMYNITTYGQESHFNGFKNYEILLSQSSFLKSLYNTLILTLMGLLVIPIGFLFAVLINGLGKGKTQSFFRVGYYLPNIITGASVVLIFQVVLMGTGGLLNGGLSLLLHRQITIGWLSDAHFSHMGATILYIWMNMGYSMLINLASMQSIPTEIYDAAAVDGASGVKKVWYITIPNMKSCFSFLAVTTAISCLSRFTDLFMLGGNSAGGFPGGTLQTILMYIYQFSFESPNYGISSAGAMILFVLVLVITLINVKITGMFDEEK